MPVTQTSIVDAATAEWKTWGKASWNRLTGKKSTGFHVDDEDDYARYVIDNYCRTVYGQPVSWPTPPLIANDDYAWSAVTISHIMRKAGFSASEFPVSDAHSKYIKWSIKARKNEDKSAAYWGYKVNEAKAKPEVGDLVGYVRAGNLTQAQALAYYDKTGSYPSHTDIVVAKRPGEIDVIGGNVLDSVTRKTMKLNANGLLADTGNDWFVVMKKR